MFKIARFAAAKRLPEKAVGPITIEGESAYALTACHDCPPNEAPRRRCVHKRRRDDSRAVGDSDPIAANLAALPTNSIWLRFAERVMGPSSLASQYRAARVGRTNSSCWFNAVRTDLNSTTCPRQFRDPRFIEHSPRKLTSKEPGVNSGVIGRLSGAHYEYRARNRSRIGEASGKTFCSTARRTLCRAIPR